MKHTLVFLALLSSIGLLTAKLPPIEMGGGIEFAGKQSVEQDLYTGKEEDFDTKFCSSGYLEVVGNVFPALQMGGGLEVQDIRKIEQTEGEAEFRFVSLYLVTRLHHPRFEESPVSPELLVHLGINGLSGNSTYFERCDFGGTWHAALGAGVMLWSRWTVSCMYSAHYGYVELPNVSGRQQVAQRNLRLRVGFRFN